MEGFSPLAEIARDRQMAKAIQTRWSVLKADLGRRVI